jgi:CHC2 zinc finger
MSNMFGSQPHAQISQDLRACQRRMPGCASRLYVFLALYTQDHSRITTAFTDAEITAATGMDAKTIKAGREWLEPRRLIEYDSYHKEYSLCSGGEILNGRFDGSGRTYGKREVDFSKRSPEERARYFEHYLGPVLHDNIGNLKMSGDYLCAFHEERTPSMSVDLAKGQFMCHHDGPAGGVVAFEMAISNCDKATAGRKINAIMNSQPMAEEPAENIYVYHDEWAKEVYEIHRFPKGSPKKFKSRPTNVLPGKWGIKGITRYLYNLPAVIASTTVIVVEGEKDADRVDDLKLVALSGTVIPATTNPYGAVAGAWHRSYSPFFAHKKVLIFTDADPSGWVHGETVQKSISQFTSPTNISMVTSWGGFTDVSEWLDAGHCREDLMNKIEQDTGQLWFYRTTELGLEA